MPGHETPQLAPAGATPVRCRPRFPSRNRRFPDRCRSPDCASTAFRCRCLLLRQKLFVLPCRRLRNNYILCPTGTPTFAAARRQRRDLIIANPVEANTPTVAGQAVAEASAPVNAGTVLLTDSDDRCTPPASTHRQIRTCPPRAKGSLDRRSKWFSLVPFFLQKRKVLVPEHETPHPAPAGATPARRRGGETLPPPQAQKRDGLRRLFLYLISCPCGSATPAPAPARISASCSPPPACRSGCPARSTSRTQTWPR